MDRTAKAEELLRELGGRARLVVYIASAPGSGKTRRLLEDARRLAAEGSASQSAGSKRRDAPTWSARGRSFPHSPRRARVGDRTFEDFDFEAAVREKPGVIVLDELAHEISATPHMPNVGKTRWRSSAGIGVIGAFNIQHLETVAPTAEALIGYPVREIVRFRFCRPPMK